jgi:hypothetical protein
MPSKHPDDLRCPQCGSNTSEATVQYGSYVLRCAACKAGIVATSWMAIGPQWNHAVRVYRDDGGEGQPLLEGVGSALWERIAEIAADGTTLLLK